MSKDLLNTTDISENIAGVPKKQRIATNPTHSAVTRYVCISKDGITPHTWRDQIEIIKKEDAIAAGSGADTTGTVSAVKSKGLFVNTKSVSSRTEAQSTFTQHTSANNPGDIINEKNIITSERNIKEFHKLDLGGVGVNDPEICSKSVTHEPEVLSGNRNKARTDKLATNIKVKSVSSRCQTSTEVHELKSANFEEKGSKDTTKRKLFHNRNKTREYILQQKQKRKERFAIEQSKKNMEDEMKKVKLQTLREKSLRIVKTNVKKSLSKKRSAEKLNNLGLGITSNHNGKDDDLQTPAVTVNMKSVSQKSVTVAKYTVTESIPSRVPLSAKHDNDVDVTNSSSLHDSNGGNSNKSSTTDLELKDHQKIRNELDLKIRAVAKALSAELESSILHSSYALSDKITNDSNNLSLQRPSLKLRDTVCSKQPVTHNMENIRMANVDNAVINISDSPPTKLKRYDHTKQMKSLEKKMELVNHTINMLRENNIIKSVEQSTRGQPSIFEELEEVPKENSIELEKKSCQKTVESPQQYFSKRSSFPFRPGHNSETTENSRKLLKKRRIANKTNNIQNHSITATQMVLSHVPQISMGRSSASSSHISESDNIGKRDNVQPQANKYIDEIMNLNYFPSPFAYNLQTVENNIHVTPVEQKKDTELRRKPFKNAQSTDDSCNKRMDKKSQLQTVIVTTDQEPVKECEFKVQPHEKLKKLLIQQAHQNDQYAIHSPLVHDVTTRSPGAVAELFKRAVEREKRERAATRIQALYRGHSTRKITAPLLTGTKSKGDVQKMKLQEEKCQDDTKRETRYTEDLSGSKFSTGEPAGWLELEPVKPCPYNVMTAVRQKLLALKKVSDAKIETKATNICTDQTLADDKSGTDGSNMSTPHQHREVCTSGLWVEESAMAKKSNVTPATEKRKKVHAVKLRSVKEYSSSDVEGRSNNRKTNGSNKSYVFSEEATWIENEEPEQKGIASSHLSAINKTNITQRSKNQNKTCESSAKSSVVGSGVEQSLTCNLKNNSESLALPDVHLVRKRRHSENETLSIPSNFKESCSSDMKQRENSLPTSKVDWIEASVHLSSAQTSFPSESNNTTKNNESQTHKESATEAKSDHGAKNSNYSKNAMSSINISDTGHAEKSSSQSTGITLETQSKRTVSAYSGRSANGSYGRPKLQSVLESGKMMPPEALHLQFQAEINLLESLEKSRLRLAHIEGLHALSLIQHQNHPIAAGQKDKEQVMSDHQQHPATTYDKIDGFDKNRREFSAVLESMRKCAAHFGAKQEDIDWLTFSDVSNPAKGSNSQAKCEKQEKELFQTDRSTLKNSEMNIFGENKDIQNVKYSYDSSFTSVSEDVSGHTSSTKSKPSKFSSLSDSTITKTLDTALKKGQLSVAAYCKYEKLIQEEATRSREQAILLDATEHALVDRFKADMMSLETNKRQLKQCGKENLIPSIKKKQRALVLKLEHDREEIKRLRNTYMEASKEWRNLLLQHLSLTKCNVADSAILGKTQQEMLMTSTTCISTEPGIPMDQTKKSVVRNISSLPAEVSSSIKTELSQHSVQSTRSAGSGSWSTNQKTENSITVQSIADVCTDLTKTETAAQTNSSERRHSLLPSKRLWSHDEISDWQESLGEDKRRVRPFKYHQDNSISPMRVLKTEKQQINLSRSADSLPVENNSAATCYDRDSVCGKNSSSGRAVPVIGSDNKNNSASHKIAATDPSEEALCKRSDASIRMSVSPQSGIKRQSSGSDESIMFSQGDTPSEQSDLEGRICALREQLRRRELEAEKLKQLQRRKAHREKLKATEQSLLKQIQVLDSYITRTKEELKQDFNTSSLPAVKPKIKQPRVRTEQKSKHILDKTKEKAQPHEQTERNSNHVLDKTEYEPPPDNTSQKSISNGTSTEIPTVILSEQTANSVTFLAEDTNSITFRDAHTSEDEIISVSSSYKRRTEAPDSTGDYVPNEQNSHSKTKNTTVKSDKLSSDYEKHTNSSQVLDSYSTQAKEEVIQDFNSSPLLPVKPKVKQPHVRTEQSTKHIVGKHKEKSRLHEQTERISNQVLDKAEFESSSDKTSQKSVSNGKTSEIPTVILSEQTANSVTFLPEDANNVTSREAHTSEDGSHQGDIISVSGSYERTTNSPDSTVDYVSNDKSSYIKNKDANIKTASMKGISSLSSDLQSSVCVKRTKSVHSFSANEYSGAESDHFLEEDREISEILIDSTFVVDNAEFSSTEQCKDSRNDCVQESCVSSSLKPVDNLSEDESNDVFSKRDNSSVNNIAAQGTGLKSCISTSINEELSEIEETSMSVHQISDFPEVQKDLSVDSIQHEITEKTELELENVVNATDLVSVPQNVSDTECILTSDIEMKDASHNILTSGREEIEDNKQEVLLPSENQSQQLEKDISVDPVLSVYSNNTKRDGDVTEFYHGSGDSTCSESHPIPVQLNSTYVVEHEEQAPQEQTVQQFKIHVDSEENENRIQKLKLVDNITESIMLQLLKDSFVLPDSKLKECGERINDSALRKTVFSEAHNFSEISKPDISLISKIRPDSRTIIVDETQKQENLVIEQQPKPADEICISNNTFLLDESSKSEKNTSELVDEMLNHFLKNATSDVLNIYNKKVSNSDRLYVTSEASKEFIESQSESGNDIDHRLPDHDTVYNPSEIINNKLKNNNTHLSVNDMISNDILKESFHKMKEVNIENGLQDMISFTSPDSKRVQEVELSVEDVECSEEGFNTSEKLVSGTDCEQLHETEKDDVSSESLITDEGHSQLHYSLTTADEVVLSEELLPNGSKSKVATQNGNKLKDISHQQKVEVRGKQTVNNETFPPGWFDEELDLSNSWREAEQLRLQQLHIEQEIRRLEEQQHQQQALVLVREIPDKPPPPYTPRGTTLLSSSPLYPSPAIGASAPRHRLVELVAEATPLLTSTGTSSMLPPEDFCTGYNPSIRRFIFDLGRSLVNEAVSVPGTDDECGEETSSQQMTVKRSQEAVRAHVTRRATALLDGSAGVGPGSSGKLRRLAVGPRWRRRDHVDELLVREARDEEPGWIDYRRDEAHLRSETACALLHDLLDDTVTAITTAIVKRMAHKATGVM